MDEQLLDPCVRQFANFRDFKQRTPIDGNCNFTTYELPYDDCPTSDSMRNLERFAEGSFNIGPIKVTRKYIPIGCPPEDDKRGHDEKFAFYTQVENTEK
jgi:hypothetical protein